MKKESNFVLNSSPTVFYNTEEEKALTFFKKNSLPYNFSAKLEQ